MQFRIFDRVVTIYFGKKGKDFRFVVRSTFLEPPVLGINSNVCGNDIYKNQLHFGMIDVDDNLTLSELRKKTKEIQNTFREFVGDGYIYETSPRKYSLHFYQLAPYWDWLKVIHFCNGFIDPQYCKWRLLRNSMVMRLSPKSSGFIPKLVEVVKSRYPKDDDEIPKQIVLQFLNREVEMRDGAQGR